MQHPSLVIVASEEAKDKRIDYILNLSTIRDVHYKYCTKSATVVAKNRKLEMDGFVIPSKTGRYSRTTGIHENFKDSGTFAVKTISNVKFRVINLSTLSYLTSIARGAIDV